MQGQNHKLNPTVVSSVTHLCPTICGCSICACVLWKTTEDSPYPWGGEGRSPVPAEGAGFLTDEVEGTLPLLYQRGAQLRHVIRVVRRLTLCIHHRWLNSNLDFITANLDQIMQQRDTFDEISTETFNNTSVQMLSMKWNSTNDWPSREVQINLNIYLCIFNCKPTFAF